MLTESWKTGVLYEIMGVICSNNEILSVNKTVPVQGTSDEAIHWNQQQIPNSCALKQKCNFHNDEVTPLSYQGLERV